MRKELLDIIKCPACGNFGKEKFQLVESKATPLEIKEAKLVCNLCREIFEVKNGILNLLYKPGREVLEEIKGILEALAESHTQYDDRMLLSLPEAAESKNPFDSTYKYSLNFYKIIKELNITGNESILDLGSGNTWSSNKFAQMRCSCVALDVSVPKFKGLESAETYFKSCAVYYERVVSDMKKLPFVDCAFDIVMSNSSIHHALNLRGVLKEINRVLKRQGKLVLINEAVCSMFSMVRDKNRKNLPEFVKRFNWTENTYSITQYLRYIKSEGFTKCRVFFPPSVDARLSGMRIIKPGSKNKTIKYRAAFFISLIWNRRIRNFIKTLIFWPAIIIFGMPLVLLAKKRDK